MNFKGGHAGAFRIICVCNGDAEHRHNSVADVLVDSATIGFDDVVDRLEEAIQQCMRLFCTKRVGEPGEI